MGKKLQKKKKRNTRNRKRRPENNAIFEEKNDDRISNLPDDLLLYIISLLPVECSMRTRFLSKQWSNLWKTNIPELNGTAEDIPALVMELFNPYCCNPMLPCSREVRFRFGKTNLLVATFEYNEKLLHLKFSGGSGDGNYDDSWHLPGFFPYSCIMKPAVKILHLTSVSSLTTEKITALVPCFMNLESLQIAECNRLETFSIGDSIFIHESFQFLTSLTILDCSELSLVHMFSWKLKIFRFRGKPAIFFYHRSDPAIETAQIYFREGPQRIYGMHCRSMLNLLPFKNVQTLTITSWHIPMAMPIFCKNYKPRKDDLVFNNLKQLRWIDSSMKNHRIDRLLYFLHRCPSLVKLFMTIDPTCYSGPERRRISRGSHAACFKKLRVIELENFTDHCDEIALVDHLCKVAVVPAKTMFILGSKWHDW